LAFVSDASFRPPGSTERTAAIFPFSQIALVFVVSRLLLPLVPSPLVAVSFASCFKQVGFRCVCALIPPKCFSVQKHFCQDGLLSPDDVWWCLPPLRIQFNWTTSTFPSWVFILGLSRHLGAFKEKLLTDCFEKRKTVIFINRIHFPRAVLLERRKKYPTTMMKPDEAHLLATLDISEHAGTNQQCGQH
jgi:hypothetical protein